ncbi:uncharacterized protein LOC118752344 [Rhagoletis pomonella]|uniref:uncharacterized protein LOC118752344 n=1 Tax=Rhagoletis pomonella TaxID=28610 RepID=UPI001783DB8F|nr:uncharacterized protein LOC118752344 [Rhagoletis pomonella]
MQKESLANEDAINDVEADHIESQIASVFSVVPCAAHTIQLAAYDVIKTIEKDLEECRTIVKKLRTLVRAGNTDISLPFIDNRTRWNSTYDMMESLYRIKEYIENLDKNMYINWSFVKDFLTAFQPISKCTLKLQNKQYIIRDFFRDWLTCELELADLVPDNVYADSLLNAMKIRKNVLLEYKAFVAALYLDPRFNFEETPLLSSEQKDVAMDHLIRTYEMIQKIENPSE